MIPAANPAAQYYSHRAEIDAAIRRVLERGRYVLDAEVEAFESAFAAYVGVPFAIGVGSGTEALHLALRACGIGPSDEVITVSHTATATVAAIELCGATPVLVDIDATRYTLAPEHLRLALTARTKALVPVHLYGQAADLEPMLEIARQNGIRVIEDAAQAHGAAYRGRRLGAWGDLACFSFYPTKNLGALGDGGMVVTGEAKLAQRIRSLRQYGWRKRYVSHEPGWSSRLDELQAAILSVKLKYLDEANAARIRLARHYTRLLSHTDLVLPAEASENSHVYHQYVVRVKKRDAFRDALWMRGIGTRVHYPVPLHLQPAYRGRLPARNALTVTECVAREVVSLPMYPELTKVDVETVAKAIQAFFAD